MDVRLFTASAKYSSDTNKSLSCKTPMNVWLEWQQHLVLENVFQHVRVTAKGIVWLRLTVPSTRAIHPRHPPALRRILSFHHALIFKGCMWLNCCRRGLCYLVCEQTGYCHIQWYLQSIRDIWWSPPTSAMLPLISSLSVHDIFYSPLGTNVSYACITVAFGDKSVWSLWMSLDSLNRSSSSWNDRPGW